MRAKELQIFWKKNYRYFINIILLCVAILFSIVLLSTSPAFPGKEGVSLTDSSVFQYIGKGMLQGRLPYKDMFDHKGPFLYILNAMGYFINPKWGIWAVEFVFLLCTLVINYKTCRIMDVTLSGSIECIFLTFLLLKFYYESGNLTEEYAMLFISIAQYYFLKYLYKNQINCFEIGIVGMSLAAILMIRANMIGVWIGYGIVILFQLLVKKKIATIFKFTLYMVSGVIVGVLPFGIWLGLNGIWEEFVDSYLIFNFKYTMSSSSRSFSEIFELFFIKGKNYLVIFFIIAALFCVYCKKNKRMNRLAYSFMGILSSIIISVYLICMPRRAYPHYAMVILPIIVGLYIILYYFLKICLKKNSVIFKTMIFCLIFLNVGLLYRNCSVYINAWNSRVTDDNSEDRKVIEAIINNSEEEDKILVLGNVCNIYLRTNRMAASKYMYQNPISWMNNDIVGEVSVDVKENKPQIIVLKKSEIENIRTLYSEALEYIDRNYFEIYDDGEYLLLKLK